MYQFKTNKKLSECKDSELVYIPENAEHDEGYTKIDLINLCGNVNAAQVLLDRLEWQHPETIIEDDNLFD